MLTSFIDRLRPFYCIGNNSLNLWMIINRIFFMSRLEIEDLAVAAGEGAAAAEDFADVAFA